MAFSPAAEPAATLPRWARAALDSLSAVLFAARCRLCDALLSTASRVPVCPGCLGRVAPLELRASCDLCQRPISAAAAPEAGAVCGACRTDPPAFDCLRGFGAYRGVLGDLIVLLKYGGIAPLAAPMGGWLALALAEHPRLAEVDALVPVPLHASRQRQRGYNQAELLARELARWARLPVETGWLARVKDTPSQTGLTRPQRIENMRGAFAVSEAAKLDSGRILLVDDVCTTGATLDACARRLKAAGAATVQALVVARVLEEI